MTKKRTSQKYDFKEVATFEASEKELAEAASVVAKVETLMKNRKMVAKATEHRTASYKAGYRFAFELRFSAVLGDPIPDGQLPYANTRPSKPSTLFDQPRGKNPLYTLEEEHAKAALDKKEKKK